MTIFRRFRTVTHAALVNRYVLMRRNHKHNVSGTVYIFIITYSGLLDILGDSTIMSFSTADFDVKGKILVLAACSVSAMRTVLLNMPSVKMPAVMFLHVLLRTSLISGACHAFHSPLSIMYMELGVLHSDGPDGDASCWHHLNISNQIGGYLQYTARPGMWTEFVLEVSARSQW